MKENEISQAADELQDMIALEVGKLADRILGRPELGTPEWFEADRILGRPELGTPEWFEAQKNQQEDQREWHLCKVAILRAAGASQTGAVMNARRYGATWQQIADACGITRQAAHDRWGKFTSQD